MSEDFPGRKFGIETKSSEVFDGGSTSSQKEELIEAEIPEQDLYHPKSFITKWIFCQDAKVIGIQYSITAISIGLVALVLSWLMRLQLAFPDVFFSMGPAAYYQFVTMHGMIMVVYLLTALFRRIWKFFNTTNGWV